MKEFSIMPESASNFAPDIDYQYWILTALTIIFSLLVFLPLAFFVIKYRAGNTKVNRQNQVHHNVPLELAWTFIPFFIGLPVFIWAAKLYVEMYTPVDKSKALEVFVVGKQWMWHLQHPTGQRENNELHIPKGVPIRLTMISQDVIHAFFVPAFRVKKDVVPGRYSTIWFVPTKTGTFNFFCVEFCGTKHSEMIGKVTVMEPEDYQAWLKKPENVWSIGARQTMAQAGEKKFFEKGCTDCHGQDSGKVPLAGIYDTQRTMADGRTVTADDLYIRHSILEPGAMILANTPTDMVMPPFKGQIDEQEILQIIAYLRNLRASSLPNVIPANEAKLEVTR